MRKCLLAVLLVGQARAQSAENAIELLRKTKTFGEQLKSWRVGFTQTSKVAGPGINLKGEVHTKIASQPPLKMSRVNSGDDHTIMVCDGVNFFYSGDAHSYYKDEATQQCTIPMTALYEPSLKQLLEPSNRLVSLSVLGGDHVLLEDGERRCVVLRAELNQGSVHTIRTVCIDPTRPLVLRDIVDVENQANGVRSSTTTTLTSVELNPDISPDTFRFIISPGAIEAHPPH